MDTSGILINLLTSIIGGAFVAWLFAPTDVTGQALRRLKIMGSILYRTLGLLGACVMLFSSAYEFYKFAYSDAPIERIEVIGLFFYALNFFVYLIITMALILIWIKGDKQPAIKTP
jgi:hypothetical protein